MVVSLLCIVIYPELVTKLMDISPSALPCPNTQEHMRISVDSYESIGYPKMDINHWDVAIQYDL